MTQTPTAANPTADRLTRTYVDLVYASALRRLRGDAHRAADVTQAVMLLMLRKAEAGKLPQEKYMAGWLIKVTGYAVMQANRSAARRTRHEAEASRVLPHQFTDNETNADIRDALDESLLKLNAVDREVIVRRCLQDQSLAEIGQAIGMSENTVGKRIVRAIPKLRSILLRRGITAPTAAIATVLAAELAVKAPAAAAVASTITPAIAELAKNLSWRIAMLKVKMAALVGLAIAILAGAGTAVVISKTQTASTNPTTSPAPIIWPSAPPTIDVSREVDRPNDAILKELLAGLQLNQGKLHTIHVHAVDAARMYDSQTKMWNDSGMGDGQAWLEAGNNRRFRAELTKDQSRAMDNSGQLGPVKDSSYVETWDGTTMLREYQPPFSVPQGETFTTRYLKSRSLAGSDFSMQLPWDEESRSDAKGSHMTIDRNPLDPAVLAVMKLSARRVILSTGQTAMELTVNIPDPNVQRIETFWFDPHRDYGLLARRNTLSVQNSVVFKQTYVIETLTEAAPGIFYPSKAQMLWEMRGAPFIWQTFSASQVAANEPVDATTFTLNFSPGIDIYDFKDGIGTKRKPSTAPH